MVNSKVILLVTLLFSSLAGFAQMDMPKCAPYHTSQWYANHEKLVNDSQDIVVATLKSKVKVQEFPTLRADFKSDTGIAMHSTRRKSNGRRYSLNDREMWDTTDWTFQVTDTLKGNMKKGEYFNFITLEKEAANEYPLTPILCDYKLSFSVGKQYLIFKNSYHPDGYRQVSGKSDRWLSQVRDLIKKSPAKK